MTDKEKISAKIEQHNCNGGRTMTEELDPLGIYTEEELSMLQYIRTIPNEIKDAMLRLAEGL